MKKKNITASVFFITAILLVFFSAKTFLKMKETSPIFEGPGVTEHKMLSDYIPELKGSNGDTDIYVLKGKQEGGSALVLGGTHPNEPSSNLAAVLLIENVSVEQGTLYVIPRANNSAFTHNDAQEASPQKYYIETPYGERWFRYGSRATNPIDQWPDPDVYIHASSGQHLSGSETRNLNRGYPGRLDGTLTERICLGITTLIQQEKIDLSIDLHEASPEYPVINAIVSHERAMPLAAEVTMEMQIEGIDIGLEPSPINLRGLSHRELGDSTDTYAVLMETANASQGRLRGATNAELALTGKDKMYVKAAKLGRLFVPWDENGHPIEERVGRHLTGIRFFFEALTNSDEAKTLLVSDIPPYDSLLEKGIGAFLLPVKEE